MVTNVEIFNAIMAQVNPDGYCGATEELLLLFPFMLSLVSGFLILIYNITDANYHP